MLRGFYPRVQSGKRMVLPWVRFEGGVFRCNCSPEGFGNRNGRGLGMEMGGVFVFLFVFFFMLF